jgi:hypothetical protein
VPDGTDTSELDGITIAGQCCEVGKESDPTGCVRSTVPQTDPKHNDLCIFGYGSGREAKKYTDVFAECEVRGLAVCKQSCANYGCGYNSVPVWTSLPCTIEAGEEPPPSPPVAEFVGTPSPPPPLPPDTPPPPPPTPNPPLPPKHPPFPPPSPPAPPPGAPPPPSPPAPPSSPPTAIQIEQDLASQQSSTLGVVVGAAAGAAVLLCLLGVFGYWRYQKKLKATLKYAQLAEEDPFKLYGRVEHAKYGKGTIDEIDSEGNAVVSFDEAGAGKGNGKYSPEQQIRKLTPLFKMGQRIKHDKHGAGIITEFFPQGRVCVNFDKGEQHNYRPESQHKLHPLNLSGARVYHDKHGPGTVTDFLPDGRCMVHFDSGEEHNYRPESQWKLREMDADGKVIGEPPKKPKSEGSMSDLGVGGSAELQAAKERIGELQESVLYANEREMQAKRELEKQLAEQAKQIEMLSKLFGKVEGMAGADSSMKKLLDDHKDEMGAAKKMGSKWLSKAKSTVRRPAAATAAAAAPHPARRNSLPQPRVEEAPTVPADRRRRPAARHVPPAAADAAPPFPPAARGRGAGQEVSAAGER